MAIYVSSGMQYPYVQYVVRSISNFCAGRQVEVFGSFMDTFVFCEYVNSDKDEAVEEFDVKLS
jgi:hypothetical protein